MIRDITLGQYYPGESVFHKADPRTKILLTIAIMALIIIKGTFPSYGIVFAMLIVTILISKLQLKFIFKGLKPILFIVVFAFLLNIFTTSTGTILVRVWFIKITSDGLVNGFKMFSRIFLLVLSASFMTYTTTPILLTDGIEKLLNLLKKIKFPVHEMAMMMTIALRFIPTLMEETDKIIKAQSSRGADFDSGGIMKRAKSFIPVLIPLFISAFRRADELAIAMESRCYRGDIGRTRMKELRYTLSDLKLIVGFLTFTAIWYFV